MLFLQHKQTVCLIVTTFIASTIFPQNLGGQKILVGYDAPAFIVFNSEVINVEFSSLEGSRSYLNKVRNNNTLCISYRKDTKIPPNNIGLTVQEGKRSHYFIIIYKKNYDINRDPPLWYDYSDLKALKKYVRAQNAASKDEAQRLEDEEKKKKEADAIVDSKKKMEIVGAKGKVEMETAKKIEAANQRAFEEALAKAKEDEQRKAGEAKKATELTKQKELDRQKAESLLIQKQAEREKAEKLGKEKKKAKALAKEEALRKKEVRKKTDELAKAKRDEELKKKEHGDAIALLEKMNEEKKAKGEANKYTRAGLLSRYGSKGINVFELPENQMNLVNVDFFLTKDTSRNFKISQHILNEGNTNLNIASRKTVNGGVSLILESITFNGANVYFKILIHNKSNDDFLMGTTGVYWYNSNGSPKMWLKCSYITYIQSFPIVPPGKEARIVLVIRNVNMQDNELLDINISERRVKKDKLDLVLEGNIYNREKMKSER